MVRQAFFIAVAFSAGCSSAIKVKQDVDPREYARCGSPGLLSLAGFTFAKKDTGDVVSGAGRAVHLDPLTAYSRAVFQAIVERQAKAKLFSARSETETVSLDTAMLRCRRTVTADTEGKFAFTDLPPGNYIISSYVSWTTPEGRWVGQWNIDIVGVRGNKQRRPLELSGSPEFVAPAPKP